MSSFFREILDWSEAWAPLVPLIILLLCRSKAPYLKPVYIYLCIAFALNVYQDVLWKFSLALNNNYVYNISSVVRLLLFSWFFIGLRHRFMHRLKMIIPIGFLIFVLINFIFFEHFIPWRYELFSNRLFTIESALLIFYCMQYFIYIIIEEKSTRLRYQPGFWVVIGLSIYMAANFFIFLFWEYLVAQTKNFALGIWDVHNITFIIFCIFIAIQFIQEHRKISPKWT